MEGVVELLEDLFKGFGVVSFLEGLVGLQRERELLGTKLGDLDASMPVENAKEEDLLADPVEENGVFHILPPS
jgi:hypothetical protein